MRVRVRVRAIVRDRANPNPAPGLEVVALGSRRRLLERVLIVDPARVDRVHKDGRARV